MHWVRIISCSENELPDSDIPPHLSGCGETDKAPIYVSCGSLGAGDWKSRAARRRLLPGGLVGHLRGAGAVCKTYMIP